MALLEAERTAYTPSHGALELISGAVTAVRTSPTKRNANNALSPTGKEMELCQDLSTHAPQLHQLEVCSEASDTLTTLDKGNKEPLSKEETPKRRQATRNYSGKPGLCPLPSCWLRAR